jgi:hypothetical protein
VKKNGFAPILIILVISILGAVVYAKYNRSANLPLSSPSPIAQEPTDNRNCISNETKVTDAKSYFTNKWYEDFTTSGSWGQLKPDGTVPEGWGLDYAGPNDTRPSSGVGSWRFDNGTLFRKHALYKSEYSLSGFRYFEYKGNIFAVPREYSGIIFGQSKTKIEGFFENQISPMWDANFKCNK